MMKKLAYPLIAFLFCTLFATAQINYQPGYMVNLKGDTTFGYINYKEWKDAPKAVEFKASLTTEAPEKITVKDAKAFAITGAEYFERHTLPISKDYVDLGRLSTGIKITYKVETVFTKVIHPGGPVKLYQYSDDVKTRLYVSETPDSLAELVYRSYYDPREAGSVLYQKGYLIQLIDLANKYGVGSDAFIDRINKADYNEKEILAIVIKIDGAKDYVDPRRKEVHLFQPFIGLALNATTVKYNGDLPLANGKSNYSYLPRISIGSNLYFDQRRRYYVKGDLSFTAVKSTVTDARNDVISTDDLTTTGNFKQYTAALSVQFVLNIYNHTNFRAFAATGFVANLSKYSNHTYEVYDAYSKRTVNDPSLLAIQSYWGQIPFTAGVTLHNKFEFFGSYMLPSKIVTQYVYFGAKEYAMHFGINYLLGK